MCVCVCVCVCVCARVCACVCMCMFVCEDRIRDLRTIDREMSFVCVCALVRERERETHTHPHTHNEKKDRRCVYVCVYVGVRDAGIMRDCTQVYIRVCGRRVLLR